MISRGYAENLRQSFLKIYPKVFLPDGWGMNSKLILNQIQPLSTGPSTSSARSSCRKLKHRSIQCSSMASYDPLNLHGVPRYYSYQRKTAAFGFVWTTIGWIRGRSGIGIFYHYRKKWWTVSKVPRCLAKLIYSRDTSKCQYVTMMYLRPHLERIGDRRNLWWCLLVLPTPLGSSCIWYKTSSMNILIILLSSLLTTSWYFPGP